MANRIVPGYPMPVSTKIEVVIDHDGPASYANVVVSAGAGDVINAADLGLGGIEDVNADGLSSDGLNFVYATPTVLSTSGTQANIPASVTLRWIVLATGAEVANTTNLSGKSIRLRIRGI